MFYAQTVPYQQYLEGSQEVHGIRMRLQKRKKRIQLRVQSIRLREALYQNHKPVRVKREVLINN